MRSDEAPDLVRLAAVLEDGAVRLGRRGTEDLDAEPAREVEAIRRILTHTAADLAHHATVVRRLDEEIDLLRRRRGRADPAVLNDLVRQRERASRQVHAGIDAATRTLVPGGDRLEPTTILRRLGGVQSVPRRSYFGRPAVDRSARLRRLTARLLQAPAARHLARPAPDTARAIRIPARSSRLARLRGRLVGSPGGGRPITDATEATP